MNEYRGVKSRPNKKKSRPNKKKSRPNKKKRILGSAHFV
jgi:hypothetical protein